MGTMIPGGPVISGGTRREKPKKNYGFSYALRQIVKWALIIFALRIAMDAAPLLLGFDPVDAEDFSRVPGFGKAKIEAFMTGWNHAHGITEGSARFTNENGQVITFTSRNGELVGVTADGYGDDETDKMNDDLTKAREIMRKWGLD